MMEAVAKDYSLRERSLANYKGVPCTHIGTHTFPWEW